MPKFITINLQLFAEEGQENAGGTPEDYASAEATGKTYTEDEFRAEVDKLTKQHQEELAAKLEAAKQEAEKLAKMSQDEKNQFELEKRLKELEDREKALAMRELRTETAKLVAKEGLPDEVVDLILADDQENTKKNFERFKTVFDGAVQAAVEERLKGKSPTTGTDTQKTAEELVRQQFASSLKGV